MVSSFDNPRPIVRFVMGLFPVFKVTLGSSKSKLWKSRGLFMKKSQMSPEAKPIANTFAK